MALTLLQVVASVFTLTLVAYDQVLPLVLTFPTLCKMYAMRFGAPSNALVFV